MSSRGGGKNVECRCKRCKYNNNGQCGYQGRIVINQNGECDSREDSFDDTPGPF